MEVENQSKVENVEVREDNVRLGYEPQSELELINKLKNKINYIYE